MLSKKIGLMLLATLLGSALLSVALMTWVFIRSNEVPVNKTVTPAPVTKSGSVMLSSDLAASRLVDVRIVGQTASVAKLLETAAQTVESAPLMIASAANVLDPREAACA